MDEYMGSFKILCKTLNILSNLLFLSWINSPLNYRPIHHRKISWHKNSIWLIWLPLGLLRSCINAFVGAYIEVDNISTIIHSRIFFVAAHNAIWPDPFDGIERTELDQSEASNFQVARIVLYWVYYIWLLCLHAECIIQ